MMMETETNRTSICIHCCTPLGLSNEDDKTNKIQQWCHSRQKSSSCSTNFVTKALSSVFKLNFLKAFDTLEWDHQQEAEEMDEQLMCINCNNVLTNLYELYNDFLHLGQIDSVLSQKLDRVDEIIDRHAQKAINCDLLISTTAAKSQEDDGENCDISVSPIIVTNSLPSTKCNIFSKELKISLTPLPKHHLTITTTSTTAHEQDDFSDDHFSSDHHEDENEDDADYKPEIKSEDEEEDELSDISIKSVKVDLDEEDAEEEEEKPLATRSKRSKVSETSRHKLQKESTNSRSMKSSFSRTRTLDNKIYKPKKKHREGIHATKYLALKLKFANPCWYCERRDFDTPKDCLEHTMTDHLPKFNKKFSGPLQVCTRCSKITRSAISFNSHLKWCQSVTSGFTVSKQLPCKVCSNLFLDKKALNGHMKCHNSERPYACDQCEFRAKALHRLASHKKYRHNAESRIKCDQCDVYLKNDHTLRTHKTIMHTAEGYKNYREKQVLILARARERNKAKATVSTVCTDCNVDLFSRLGFVNHRRKVHHDNMGSQFTCDTCGKNFTCKRSFYDHTTRAHSEDRPFICDTCGKSFKRNYSLKAHVDQTHTEEGRLKYNEKTREKNRRRKMVASLLAKAGVQT